LFEQPGGRAVLLSLLPKYAEQIASGLKRVEFRRAWTPVHVAVLTLYATAPVSRVIGIARIGKVVEAPPTELWRYAKEYGGGLSRRELYAYMSGKKKGFALFLEHVVVLDPPVDPRRVTSTFRAPQSFRFLAPEEFRRFTQTPPAGRVGAEA
jgi:predicted transcriptional regulator